MALIKFTKDPEFIIKCIKRRDKFRIGQWEVEDLIRNLGDSKYVLKCIKQYRELSFNLDFIIRLLEQYPNIYFEHFDEIIETFKEEQFYEDFIKRTLGDVELDEKNNPVITKEIRKLFLSDFRAIEQKYVKQFKNELPEIISKWQTVEKQIQIKKANSILNDGLEMRKGIKEILNALRTLKRPTPINASEIELDKLPESKEIGVDIQFSTNPETDVKRAYAVATKMDEIKPEKKFPDFSTETEEIIVEICHPQDKHAILSGYETGSCFRPNGKGGDSTENGGSLFEYCLTTPYGGVLKCKGKKDNKVYMGTPILINGNVLLLHSYETKNFLKNKEVNKAIEEAIKNAIKLSNGKIRAVFSTNINTGFGRFNVEQNLVINQFFKPYTEKEYKNFLYMYNRQIISPLIKNVVLAMYYKGKILTGNEIVDFFNEKCNGDEQTFISTLGLELGEITTNYEFSKKNTTQEFKIENVELVDKFYDLYQKKEKEIQILLLIKEKVKIEAKKEILESDRIRIKNIDEELKKYEDIFLGNELKNEVERRIEESLNESIRLFSGDDIWIIADYFGITKDDINKAIEQEVDNKFRAKPMTSKSESKRTKTEKRRIISKIRQSGNEYLISLIPKIIDNSIEEEQLQGIEQAGIDTSKYVELCVNKEERFDIQKSLQSKRENIIREMKKSSEIIERIVSEKVFQTITAEEIKLKIIQDIVVEIKSKIYEFYKKKKDNESLTEDDKEMINKRIHELEIENTISSFVKNGELREEKFEQYGIDVKEIYSKYLNNIDGEKRKIKLRNLKKIKASITLGIKTRENWIGIKNRITQGKYQNTEKEPITERAIYGNSWYIEYLVGEKPVIYIRENATEEEKEDLKEALKEELERMDSTYHRKMSMETIEQIASKVPESQIEEARKVTQDMFRLSFDRNE